MHNLHALFLGFRLNYILWIQDIVRNAQVAESLHLSRVDHLDRTHIEQTHVSSQECIRGVDMYVAQGTYFRVLIFVSEGLERL